MTTKQLTGTLVLKKDVESKKFSVTFPMDVKMRCSTTDGTKIMCEHPRHKHIWTNVEEKEIKTLKWD